MGKGRKERKQGGKGTYTIGDNQDALLSLVPLVGLPHIISEKDARVSKLGHDGLEGSVVLNAQVVPVVLPVQALLATLLLSVEDIY